MSKKLDDIRADAIAVMEEKMSHLKKFILSLAIVLGIAILFLGSWFTVEQGQRNVILRNGALIGIAEPGLHFKLPLLDQIIVMSVRTEKRLYEDVSSYSRDLQTANLRVSVNYHIDVTKVSDVFKTYGASTYAERALDPQVNKHVKEIFGKYTAADVVAKREQLGMEVQSAIIAATGETGLLVESVQIENIDFSEAYEQAIEAAAAEEANVKQVRQQLERDKVEAEKKAALAKGQADAEVERARGIRAIAEAEAYAIEQRGKALQQNPHLVEMTLAERWNGVLPTHMIPGQTVPFIDVK